MEASSLFGLLTSSGTKPTPLERHPSLAHVSHPIRRVFLVTPEPLTIDCDSCVMQASNACDDCIVTYICDREPEQAVVIDLADFRAMKLLAAAGLVPDLKHTGH